MIPDQGGESTIYTNRLPEDNIVIVAKESSRFQLTATNDPTGKGVNCGADSSPRNSENYVEPGC